MTVLQQLLARAGNKQIGAHLGSLGPTASRATCPTFTCSCSAVSCRGPGLQCTKRMTAQRAVSEHRRAHFAEMCLPPSN